MEDTKEIHAFACDKNELRLSEAFKSKNALAIDLVVKIIHNSEKKEKNTITFLEEFILCSRSFRMLLMKGCSSEVALRTTMKEAAKSEQMQKFLYENSKGVIEMLTFEYTQEDLIKLRQEEAREEGIIDSIQLLREVGLAENKIFEKIKKKYDLSNERIEDLLQKSM